MSLQGKNPDRVAAGLKATISRPNVSEEAKQSARERLAALGYDINKSSTKTTGRSSRKETDSADIGGGISQGEVSDLTEIQNAGGDILKPGIDSRAKQDVSEGGQYAGQDTMDDTCDNFGNIGRSQGASGGQAGEHRELGGYKAALNNPHVSEEAKEHARDMLEHAHEF